MKKVLHLFKSSIHHSLPKFPLQKAKFRLKIMNEKNVKLEIRHLRLITNSLINMNMFDFLFIWFTQFNLFLLSNVCRKPDS